MKSNNVLCGGRSVYLLTAQAVLLRMWTFDELRAPYWRLYWNLDPGAAVTFCRHRYELTSDHLLLIPPETSFGSILEKPVRHLYVHFLAQPVWGGGGIQEVPLSRGEQQKLKAIFQNACAGWAILSVVSDALGRWGADLWRPAGAVASSVQRALDAVESQLPRAVSVTELARTAGMGVNTFIRAFSRELGKTPAAYVLDRRVAAACILLHHTSKTIESIAEDCGFCDRHHFTRVFAKVRGMAPAKFRRTGTAA